MIETPGPFQRVLSWIPPKARLAVFLGSFVLVGLAIYVYLSSGSGNLSLVCRHNFQSAYLSVFVDDKLMFSDQTSGTVKRRFGILDKKVEGTFSKTLKMPLGKHVVRVHLKSSADRFDQTKQINVNMVSGETSSVAVTTERGELSVAYKGPTVGPSNESSGDYSFALRSILVTLLGSAASAVIGFIVQEFLKAKKAALAENQTSKPDYSVRKG